MTARGVPAEGSLVSRVGASLWRLVVPERVRGRSLKVTREGKILLGITLATGLAAINTGNNLLFFGWGLLLSSVLISGVLSEATLRSVRLRLRLPDELRAGAPSPLPVVMENPGARLPAFGVEALVEVKRTGESERAATRSQLRLSPGRDERMLAHWRPRRRGLYRIDELRALTRFPFGFFEKSRFFKLGAPLELLVYPRRVDVGRMPEELLSRLGSVPTHRAGGGDEFFSLRPFRDGDDPRHIHWRRSARADRWFVRETEALASRQIVLELHVDASMSAKLVEATIATCGSLAEDLLLLHHAVGLAAPGADVAPSSGARQRPAILTALAHLDPARPMQTPRARRDVARVAVTPPGAPVPAGCALRIEAMLDDDGGAR